MPMGVDDLLAACADAAAAAAGKAVGEGLVNGVLSALATKNDLAKAIAEVEDFIGKQFDDFRDDELTVNTFLAILSLRQYKNNRGNKKYLDNAVPALGLAQGWLDREIGHLGEDVLRQRYVEVVNFVTADVAVWYNRARNDSHDKQNFVDSANRLIDYLSRANKQILKWEQVTCTGITDTVDYPTYDPDTPPSSHPPIWYHSSFKVICSALPNGGYYFDAGPDREPKRTRRGAEDQRAQILVAYANDEKRRKDVIYDPSANLMDKMIKLIHRK